MMELPLKFKSDKPVLHHKMIKVDKKNAMFKCYEINPREIGEAQYQGVKLWVSDDGLTFPSPVDVEKYFVMRDAKEARGIEAGEYTVRVESVTQQSGRIILKLAGRGAGQIVINTKD